MEHLNVLWDRLPLHPIGTNNSHLLTIIYDYSSLSAASIVLCGLEIEQHFFHYWHVSRNYQQHLLYNSAIMHKKAKMNNSSVLNPNQKFLIFKRSLNNKLVRLMDVTHLHVLIHLTTEALSVKL